jgi:amino acid transporter
MMGAGLYTLLGLASTTAGVWLPVAFLVGGAVTTFSVYSYAKLGAKYPSRGGAAQFLIRCFGDVIAGGLNVFQFLGWIIAMALYCAGFAGYARALLPWHTPEWSGKAIGIGLIVAVVVVNLIGTKFVGKSEIFVITIAPVARWRWSPRRPSRRVQQASALPAGSMHATTRRPEQARSTPFC